MWCATTRNNDQERSCNSQRRKSSSLSHRASRIARPHSNAKRTGPAENAPSLFFEFSLCLSRVCLGKKMIFSIKWRKKTRFRLTDGDEWRHRCRAALAQRCVVSSWCIEISARKNIHVNPCESMRTPPCSESVRCKYTCKKSRVYRVFGIAIIVVVGGSYAVLYRKLYVYIYI